MEKLERYFALPIPFSAAPIGAGRKGREA